MNYLRKLLQICLIPVFLLIAFSHSIPSVAAESSILKWIPLETPGWRGEKNQLTSPGEVNRIAIGADGKTFYAVDISNADINDGSRSLYKSFNSGYDWDDSTGRKLFAAMTPAEKANFRIWDIAMARDDINFVAAVTNTSISNLPGNIWISTDGGNYWQDSKFPGDSSISALDICSFNSIHLIAAGTRSGTGTGGMQIFRTGDVPVWTAQLFSGDVLSLKFSPNYESDGAISVIYTDAAGTYMNTAIHDIQSEFDRLAYYLS